MASNEIGTVLRARRVAKELTLVKLAALAGVSASHIGRSEKGERFPSVQILRKLAGPLGVTETELLKIAGFLPRDQTDDRVQRLKQEIKSLLVFTLSELYKKIDSL